VTSSSESFNILPYVGANTIIRFSVIPTSYGGSNEQFIIDNVEISWTPAYRMTVVKSQAVLTDLDGNNYPSDGDVLSYTVTATNTGEQALTNVVVADPLISPSSITCATVAVAGTCVLTGTYTVSFFDEVAGVIVNTATADNDQMNLMSSNTVSTTAGSATATPPSDVFYMPLPEADALTALQSIVPVANPGVASNGETCRGSRVPISPVSTYSSITVLRDNTVIYYDHHEDSDGLDLANNEYEADILNPVQSSTEIWGDGIFANGVAPGTACLIDACDVLNAGVIIVLDNQITIPDTLVNFDGGDKILSTGTISMTKANWADDTTTLLAGALELYPTSEWGLSYEVPVGQDISALSNAKYQYVAITVMAQQDGTVVDIDLDGDPSTLGDITTVSLNEGQSYLVDGGILVGATVTSNYEVQVDIITGDICDNYESRWFTLFPTELWDNSYYSPVGTPAANFDPVRVILYNPDPVNDIVVLVQDLTASNITVTVPAGGHFDYFQNYDTAAHYCTTTDNTSCNPAGAKFYAVAGIDADADSSSTGSSAATNDWGFTLVPKSSLSQQALVGIGFGHDPLRTSTENSSPVWVTADLVNGGTPVNGGIQICVDYDNDGTDSGVALIDSVTGQEYDTTQSISLYETVTLRDPDGDQTSLLVWVCDTDADDANNAIIAVAWGQDPGNASGGSPAIDLGTGVPNVASLVLTKKGRLKNDVDGDGFPSIGDTITYLISLTNVGFVPVDGEVMTDALPGNVSYIVNSTVFDNGSGSGFVPLADVANPSTPFPLDEGGIALPGLVQVGKTFLVSFDVLVSSIPLNDVEMCNSTSINIPIEVISDEHCLDFLSRTASIGDFVWDDLDQDGIQEAGEVGIEGVTVTLLDSLGAPVSNGIGDVFSTTTAADGSWSITNLPRGDYQVLFDTTTATSGLSYSLTAQNQGVDDTVDSDGGLNGISGQSQTATFSLVTGEINNTIDAGFYQSYSVIGNRVWLDLDGDGVQDANEDGIANIPVQLTPPAGIDIGAGINTAITTVTDNNGNYIFNQLPLGIGYVVTVATPPAGFSQSFDEDGILSAHSSLVSLTVINEEHLTADFGYVPPAGSIGDYIWADANGDGQQDPGEIGLAGINVYLCLSNTVPCDSTTTNTDVIATVTTDATGRYLFSGVTLTDPVVVGVDAASLPAGYIQTGDPDGVGAPDNQTTVLALNTSNNINLDADFGYQPTGVNYSNIGDTVYQDLNGNSGQDAGELGIAGVTVQLFVDTNADNVADTSIASVITDSSGYYLFPTLPNGVTYDVVITDSNNILNTFIQTDDPDASLDSRSTLLNLAATNLLQDFGYKPIRSGAGVIGDRIFHDVNNNNSQDAPDQGLEGVKVSLFTSVDGDFVGVTFTDENGQYLFTGLDATNNYRIVVDTSTLPNGGVGWVNNIDPDGGVAAESISNLSLVGSGIDLDQDFGFAGSSVNTISGTVWTDNDGNGLLTDGSGVDPDETANGLGNVTVVLKDSNGNIVAKTTTTSSGVTIGDYNFTGLPDGDYTVSVTDDNNELANLSHTNGPNAGDNTLDNNSQDDTGYVVTVAGGETNTTADFGYQPVLTTPITLGSFKAIYSSQLGRTTISWSTLTEVGNVGFEIYRQVGGVWQKINEQLVPSKKMYHTGLLNYQYEFFGDYTQDWAIVDVDLTGKRQSHGVYKVNRLYGSDAQDSVEHAISWQEINAIHRQLSSARDSVKLEEISVLVDSISEQPLTTVNLLSMMVLSDGIYRVNYQDLIAKGINLNGVILSNLTITNNGVTVPIKVYSANGYTFDQDSYIEFVGQAESTLYQEGSLYSLGIGAQRLVEESQLQPDSNKEAEYFYLQTDVYAENLDYSFGSPINDPWFAKRVLSIGSEASELLNFNLVDPYKRGEMKIEVNIWGGTDYLQSPDHHVIYQVDGEHMADFWFDGIQSNIQEFSLPSQEYQAGNHWLKIKLPGDTQTSADVVHVESWKVTYPRYFNLSNKQIDFGIVTNEEGISYDMIFANNFESVDSKSFNQAQSKAAIKAFKYYEITNANNEEYVIYRLNQSGDVISVPSVKSDQCTVNPSPFCTLNFTLNNTPGHVFVASESTLKTPLLSLPVQLDDIHTGLADYLIISHPDFIGSSLQSFVQLKQQNHTVKVVDVQQVYGHYSYGNKEAASIAQYIKFAYNNLNVKYVLLVGGDTYDYKNYMNIASVSFIPTLYSQTDNLITFAPVDAKYADIDGDNIPDLSLGRFPVRTESELESLVDKVQKYSVKTYSNTALFVADKYDLSNGYSFKSDANELIDLLPTQWQANIGSNERAYVDDDGVNAAKTKIYNTINQGVALTSFVGHSGPRDWSFSRVFSASDANALINGNSPTLVTQWGCWNTYFVEPRENTLAHNFMLNLNGGAVSVLGASTLTKAEHEKGLARLVLSLLTQGDLTLGQAVTQAKSQYAQSNPNALDVILGWNILGDPSLRL